MRHELELLPTSDSHRGSAEHGEAARKLIPGGAHAYSRGDDQYPEGMAPFIDHASGCRVWDVDGHEYVEYGSGLRSVTLGHGHPAVLDAARSHMGMGINFSRPHRMELEAAEALLELFPQADMVKFGIHGSDATTGALRLARAYTGRDHVAICGDHPFFSVGSWFIGTTPMSAGIPQATKDLTLSFRYNDLGSIRALIDSHPEQIAAVVLEAENAVPPAPGFLEGVRALCDEHGIVLILDEIITGFRWHLNGAQHLYDIKPDLSTFAKGMCNGLPLSALVGRREIMELGGYHEERDRVFLMSQTYGAQPWALAALMAVIDTYKNESVVEKLHLAGGRLRHGCNAAIEARGLQDYISLFGRDCNLVFGTRDAAGERSQPLRTLFLQELLTRGILAQNFVVNAAHDDEAIDQTIDAVAAALGPYEHALEHGTAGVLRGRSVKPTIRPRG